MRNQKKRGITKNQLERFYDNQKKLFEFMGLDYPYRRPRTEYPETDPDKILALPDMHEPYGNEVVLKDAKENQRDASMVMVPGDVGDYYSKSRFRKTRHQTFREELRAVFLRLEWLSLNWKDVRVMLGNHDNRPEKRISALFGDDTELLIMTEQNLLGLLASYFPNIKLVGTQLDGTDTYLTHIYQHGDAIFTHGELSVTQGTGILDRVEKWLDLWAQHLKLKPFRVLFQAHNHQDLNQYRGNRKRILMPTCSDPFGVGLEYIYGSRMIGTPPAVGYTVFYQHNGVTDLNRIQNIIFEVKNGKTQPL